MNLFHVNQQMDNVLFIVLNIGAAFVAFGHQINRSEERETAWKLLDRA